MHSNPTASLWLFAYDGLTVGTHQSILQELREWSNCDYWVQPADALISRMRSKAASQFVETDRAKAGDVLVMVDHDIAWAPGDVSHIARRALERCAVVGGIYPKRTFGEGSPIWFEASPEVSGQWQIGTDALIPAQYVGSGFMAIPRLVLDALVPTLPRLTEGFWPFFLPMTHQGLYLSEDYAFQERARKAGFRVYASTYPHLTHQGRYAYRLVDAQYRPPQDREITIRLGDVTSVPV